MSEEPKSIWKKSWTGWRGLVMGWLILSFALFIIFLIWLMASGTSLTQSGDEFRLFGVAWIGVTIIFLLAIFIRWLCCWRNFKRGLFGLACFATLIALFYAEEDWRGKHDWEKFKSQWEAKGEHFSFASIVPPPVPDDQNFAMAPVFDATDKLANRKWRQEHQNPHSVNGEWWDTNLVDPLQMDDVDHGFDNGSYPTIGNWAKAMMTDMIAWQDYYRRLAAKTNEFLISLQPQTPAQDVLLALSKYDPAIEELREASQRPDSRFPLDYDDENPAEILLPHLADLKRSSMVLQLRAIAELQNGESDKALDDVKLELCLINSIRTEPIIISQLVRFANFQIALQPIYEGLAEHKWSDAQLAELDSELSKLDFLAGYELSICGERNAHIKIIDWLEQKRSHYQELFDNAIGNDLNLAFYLMPKGWYYQNDIVLAEAEQQWTLRAMDDANQTVSPKMVNQADKAIESISRRPTPFNFFALRLLPALGNFAKKTAYGQSSVDLARVAIALERYRLAHGNFPESLDALAPQFMAKIPHDIIGGGPLHYRRDPPSQSSDAAGRQFVLYSIGWDEKDDGGVVVLGGSFGKSGNVDIDKGDWVWRYPAK